MTDQVHPFEFFQLLNWIDGEPLWPRIDPYRRTIFDEAVSTRRPDGAPLYRRVLTGRAKKNAKTLDAVLVSLYKLLVWEAAGSKGNQVYYIASDLGQANDDLDLCKKLIRVNPFLDEEVLIKSNVIERRDGRGFIEILPAGDVSGLHGKTYLLAVFDEFHTQRDYRQLEALELDRTRPDSMQWFATYASLYRHAGVPLVDMLKQHEADTDPRLYVSWYGGSLEDANPSLGQSLGPTMEDILDAQRSLPSWIFRRLYLNLPGQPDGAAFDPDAVEACVVKGRRRLPPSPNIQYRAFVDMSGGGQDDSTLALGHREPDEPVVVDLLIDQGPRHGGIFDPQQTVEQFASVLKAYGCREVVGDRFAGQWPRQAFEKCGITYHVAEQTRSQLYALLEPMLNSHRVELPDSPTLLAQLIGLARRGEKIDHPSSEHDDHANAVAGVVSLLREPDLGPLCWGGGEEDVDEHALICRQEHENQRMREMACTVTGWFPGE